MMAGLRSGGCWVRVRRPGEAACRLDLRAWGREGGGLDLAGGCSAVRDGAGGAQVRGGAQPGVEIGVGGEGRRLWEEMIIRIRFWFRLGLMNWIYIGLVGNGFWV